MLFRSDEKLDAAGINHKLVVGVGLNHNWPLSPIPEARAARKQIAGIVGAGAKGVR